MGNDAFEVEILHVSDTTHTIDWSVFADTLLLLNAHPDLDAAIRLTDNLLASQRITDARQRTIQAVADDLQRKLVHMHEQLGELL